MAASRLVIPLYVFGYPGNLFRLLNPELDTRPHLCLWLVAWTAAQVGVLLLQEKYGPHFFIPSRFLPRRYDYGRPVPDELRPPPRAPGAPRDLENGDGGTGSDGEGNGWPECVVCYANVDPEAEAYMITPCNHLFHAECLSRWLDVKLECPLCRATLPTPPDDGTRQRAE